MKLRTVLISLLCVGISWNLKAQTEVYFQDMTSEDYANFKLPTLGVLYENALNAPRVEVYHQEQKVAENLLKKEKWFWLSFISLRAGYTYGVTDNYGQVTDANTPIFFQYSGMAQHYYNVGASLTIPLDDLFDLRGRIRRQRFEAKKAEYDKLREYDLLKQEIAETYVKIISGMEMLKVAAENVVLGEGRYNLMEERFKNRAVELVELSEAKFRHLDYLQKYEDIRITLSYNILRLEIISNTPILTK